MEWTRLRYYSIDEHLKGEGLSFEAFDVVQEVLKDTAYGKLKKKMANRLVKKLHGESLESNPPLNFANVSRGVYVIALDGAFEFDYAKKPSRVLYIGSGAIKSRIQSHLEGKLFDFAYDLRVVPFQFYFCDLSEVKNGDTQQRALEQALLSKFSDDTDETLPLLNAINASQKHVLADTSKGWDIPLQRDRGPQATAWLIKSKENNAWKGALQ